MMAVIVIFYFYLMSADSGERTNRTKANLLESCQNFLRFFEPYVVIFSPIQFLYACAV